MRLKRTCDLKTLRELRNRAAGLIGSIALASCGTTGYVPPEALNPPAATFAKAAATFSESVKKNELAGYKREARRDQFLKVALGVAQTPTPSMISTLSPAPQEFLCLPRYGYDRVALRLSYVSAVGTTLSERVKAPGDELAELFSALSTDYQITVTEAAPAANYDKWLSDYDAGKRCAKTVADANPYAIRDYLGKEFGIEALVAAKSVFDTVWGIIKPAVIGGLQTIDRERRAVAIKAYFSNGDNVTQLRAEIAATEAFLAKEFVLQQQRRAGRAGVSANMLFDGSAAHWKKIITIATTPPCVQDLVKWKTNKIDAGGVGCIDQIVAAAGDPLKAALDYSDAFDVAMALEMPQDRLSDQVDTLRDIALGKQPTQEKAKALWAAALRYVALFKVIDDANSSANQKKIKDAISALVEALK